MKASIIILNWNGKPEECIDSCRSALNQVDVEKEVIFIDNGSTNGSDLEVQQHVPEVTLIRTGKNLGVAAGRNFGATHAKGEIIFFLENDGVWDNPLLVSEAVELFNLHQDLGAISTLVVGYHDGKLQSPSFSADEPELTLAATFNGGACAVRRTAFEECGYFPGDFFRQGEERFITLLLYEKQYKVCYWKRHIMLHKGSSYAGKNTIVNRLNFEHELKTVARLFPSTIYRRLFWLKIGAWLFRFIKAGDMLYFLKAFLQFPTWLNERNAFSHISEKTLAIVESITTGKFRLIPAQNIYLQEIHTSQFPISIILSNFSRWLKQKNTLFSKRS